MRDPALIAARPLAGPVDAAHPKDDALDSEAVAVVEHVLVGGALRAAVRTDEIERAVLADTIGADVDVLRDAPLRLDAHRDVLERAVHLVSRRKYKARARAARAHRLEHVQRAGGVDGVVIERKLKARRHGDLRGQVVDKVAAL